MRRLRADVLAAAFVAGAALLPRLLLMTLMPERPLMADMVDYYDRALYLYQEGRLYPDAFRVPVFSMTLAGAFAIFDPGIRAARILQCTVLVLVAVATFALARSAVSRRRAMVAGLIVAWYPGLLLYTIYVMAEPLFMLLLLSALLVAQYKAGASSLFVAGLLAGLATLTRQAGVSLVAALVLWTAVSSRGLAVPVPSWRRAKLAAVILLGAATALSPWVGRNWRVFGQWMPLESTAGITYLIANYEGATGRYFISDWQAVHEKYLANNPNEFERNALAYRLAFQEISDDPIRIAALIPRRIGYLFDLEEREHTYVYSFGYLGEWNERLVRVAGWLLLLSFPALMMAAVTSVFFGPRPRASTMILVKVVLGLMLLQHANLFGDPRFHLPFVPLLAILAVRPWPVEGPRATPLSRIVGTLVIIAALSWWSCRLPSHLARLDSVAPPGGWSAAITY